MVSAEGCEAVNGSGHVFPPVVAADTDAVGTTQTVAGRNSGGGRGRELHQLPLALVDVAVDAGDASRIDSGVADRVAAGGMADGAAAGAGAST